MNVQHRAENSEFFISRNDQEAVLKYQLLSGDEVEFLSTYVPFALRGTGMAEALVISGLSWAEKNEYKVCSRCWYVDKFLST